MLIIALALLLAWVGLAVLMVSLCVAAAAGDRAGGRGQRHRRPGRTRLRLI